MFEIKTFIIILNELLDAHSIHKTSFDYVFASRGCVPESKDIFILY